MSPHEAIPNSVRVNVKAHENSIRVWGATRQIDETGEVQLVSLFNSSTQSLCLAELNMDAKKCLKEVILDKDKAEVVLLDHKVDKVRTWNKTFSQRGADMKLRLELVLRYQPALSRILRLTFSDEVYEFQQVVHKGP